MLQRFDPTKLNSPTQVQSLNECGVDGAVIVTTPQEIAMLDVRKELTFCKKTSLRVIGVVENMGTTYLPVSNMRFVDEKGTECTEEIRKKLRESCPELLKMKVLADLFPKSRGGGEGMARAYNVPFLGRIPLDPALLKCGEEGRAISSLSDSKDTAATVDGIVDRVLKGLKKNEE